MAIEIRIYNFLRLFKYNLFSLQDENKKPDCNGKTDKNQI